MPSSDAMDMDMDMDMSGTTPPPVLLLLLYLRIDWRFVTHASTTRTADSMYSRCLYMERLRSQRQHA